MTILIIKSLEIYGYGQFVHRKIEFNRAFTEIYGENEAGKSTIQAFIHSILFGFPTKKEKEPRLEPRLGNQYGGKLALILDDNSTIEVERVKGRAQGDVKVFLENGTIKDEAWLNAKLNHINKKTYQGIFSFDVLGLQDIHRNLNETQLQSYLLEAGALGSTEFGHMGEVISQKKEELYKKSGKNPILNQQLAQLKGLEAQIRDEEAKLTDYHRYVDDKDKSSRHLAHLKDNLSQLSSMHAAKQKEVALHEQTQEWKELEGKLNIEPLTFPEQGIDRYEAAKGYKQTLEQEIGLKEEALKQLTKENKQLSVPNDDTIEQFKQIYREESDIKQSEIELNARAKEISEKQHAQQEHKTSVGWQEIHHDTDTSEAAKSYASYLIKARQEEQIQQQHLTRLIDENTIEQTALVKEIEALEQDLISEDALAKKKQYNQQKLELNEKENLYQKLKDTFENEKANKIKRQQWLRFSFVLLAIVGIALAVFSFMTQNMIFTAVFAVLTLIFIVGIFLAKAKTVDYSETIGIEIQDLEQQLNYLENDYDLDFDLEEQYQLRDQWQNALKNKTIIDEKMKHQQDKLSSSHQQLDRHEHDINEVKQSLFLPTKMSDDLLLDSIKTINTIKSDDKLLQTLQQDYSHLNDKITSFYEQAKSTVQPEIERFNRSSFFDDLKDWISTSESNRQRKAELNKQITLLNNELTQLHANLAENTATIDTLFNFIGVNDEESYYAHHKAYQTYQQNLARFNDLTKYLENQNYSYEDSSALSKKTTAQLDKEDQVLAKQVDDYNEQFLAKQQEVSDLTAQIKHMETDSTLSDLRHEYHSLKNQMNEIAKDWASLSYLQALVNEHIKQIKDKRLPQVIKEATNIFNKLTNAAYVQITYADDKIMVKHHNGQVFEPMELSQSTKEILYISLRLSLIKVLKPYYHLPIIVDDAFVHFDKKRKRIMLNYLRDLAENHQVLYFTCTKDQIVPSKEMLVLNKLEEGGK